MLCLLGWPQTCDLPSSVSQTAGITGMHHSTRLRILLPLKCVCVCVCVCMRVCYVCVRQRDRETEGGTQVLPRTRISSEDDLWELVLSFHHVGPRD